MTWGNFAPARTIAEQVPAAAPHDQIPQVSQQQLQQALQGSGIDLQGLQQSLSGRPLASVGQDRYAGMIEKFAQMAQQGNEEAARTIDRMVQAANSEQDPVRRKPMLEDIRKWLEGQTRGPVSEDDLYGKFCLDDRDLTGQKPNQPSTNPPSTSTSDNSGTGTTSDATSGDSDDNIAPVRIKPPRSVTAQQALLEIISPASVARLPSSRRGIEITSPARPEATRIREGQKLPTRNSRYNPEGCQLRPPNIGQGIQQNDPNQAQSAEKSNDGTPNSPSNDQQSPNFNPGGGQGYSPKGGKPQQPQIAQSNGYGQMPGSTNPNDGCPYCSTIAGLRSKPYSSDTPGLIGNDLSSGAEKAKGIIENSKFQPMAMPQQAAQPKTLDLLKANASKSNAKSNNANKIPTLGPVGM